MNTSPPKRILLVVEPQTKYFKRPLVDALEERGHEVIIDEAMSPESLANVLGRVRAESFDGVMLTNLEAVRVDGKTDPVAWAKEVKAANPATFVYDSPPPTEGAKLYNAGIRFMNSLGENASPFRATEAMEAEMARPSMPQREARTAR